MENLYTTNFPAKFLDQGTTFLSQDATWSVGKVQHYPPWNQQQKPLEIGRIPKRKRSSSNHWFSGAFAGSFRFQEVYNLWGFTLYPQGSWVFCFSIQHVAHVECLNLLIITSHSTNIQTNECISVNQSYFNNLQIVAHCRSHFESNTKLLAWG